MENLMVAEFRRALARMGVVAALSLAVLALAACGSTAQPADDVPATTAAPPTEPASTLEGASASADTPEPEPQGNVAHLFTLPNARDGMEVSLASYRGDRNVVLVFYRGFW